MNGIILCEGSTDYSLLQYYMREAHNWIDDKNKQKNIFKIENQKSRKLTKNDKLLTIAAVGGCSRLNEGLQSVLKRNFLSSPNSTDAFDSIVMLTDRDEIETENDFIEKIDKVFQNYNICYKDKLTHNCWIDCEMVNAIGLNLSFRFLFMVIPFEEKGAMETFLLDAIAVENEYDGEIIRKSNAFVEYIDPEKRYLSSRRYMTKAKFDIYFSIRTPAEQFMERQNILKNVKWERFSLIQESFQLLGDL